jgi:tetratricopeptide (TPR) repeat protein
VPIDRDKALKNADKLLRQGKIDGAIEQYVRLVEEQPSDWTSINTLGDLYLRSGEIERAIAEFTRVADYLFDEGFLPKAAALYKKSLKIQGQHEHTLSRLAEIAERQGLLVDAKAYLRQLEQVRRKRGDEAGVADCRTRLRALEESGEPPAAPAARPAPAEPHSPTIESVGDDPGRLFALAQRELASGNELHARAILTRVLTLDPGRHGDVTQIALDLARGGRIESAFGCIDVVTDAALLEGDWQRAASALQTFAAAVPHIPALIKLVEVCVDAGLDEPMRSAQAQLADAYLDAGLGAEARMISADLLETEPDCDAHAERLKRAFELLGVADADRKVADMRGRGGAAASPREPVEPLLVDASPPEPVEIDLSEETTIGLRRPEQTSAEATERYDAAMELLRAGQVEDAIWALEAAARVPKTRVKAMAELGRLYVQRGEFEAGVKWLERAADGPSATPDEGHAVLYELADALERLGEAGRALALLIDLDADAGEYRDVRARIDQLSRLQPGRRR